MKLKKDIVVNEQLISDQCNQGTEGRNAED